MALFKLERRKYKRSKLLDLFLPITVTGLISLFMSFQVYAVEKSILMRQPYFNLDIRSQNIGFYIVVNGANVFKYFSSDRLNTEIPINQWFTSGENKIDLIAKPFAPSRSFMGKARVDVILKVSDANNLALKYKVVENVFDAELDERGLFLNKNKHSYKLNSQNNFEISKLGDVTVKEATLDVYNKEKNFVRISRQLSVPSVLPHWAFLDGDQIPSISEADMTDKEFDVFLESLLSKYRKVYNAIKNNDVDSVMSMFAERDKETDEAFYFEPGTTEKKMRAALIDAAKDEASGETELLPIGPEYLEFGIFENNTMARLKRADDGRAIVQNFKKAQGSQSFDLIFRYKNGKWILTR